MELPVVPKPNKISDDITECIDETASRDDKKESHELNFLDKQVIL